MRGGSGVSNALSAKMFEFRLPCQLNPVDPHPQFLTAHTCSAVHSDGRVHPLDVTVVGAADAHQHTPPLLLVRQGGRGRRARSRSRGHCMQTVGRSARESCGERLPTPYCRSPQPAISRERDPGPPASPPRPLTSWASSSSSLCCGSTIAASEGPRPSAAASQCSAEGSQAPKRAGACSVRRHSTSHLHAGSGTGGGRGDAAQAGADMCVWCKQQRGGSGGACVCVCMQAAETRLSKTRPGYAQ